MIRIKPLLFASTMLFMACNQNSSPKTVQPSTSEPAPPMVGADQDAHGCKPSAGYQWSVLKNDCIRLFEAGVRLNPKAQGLDQTSSAFIVFKSEKETHDVEVFLPAGGASRLLSMAAGKNNVWQADTLSLSLEHGEYALFGQNHKLLYQGH